MFPTTLASFELRSERFCVIAASRLGASFPLSSAIVINAA